MLHSLCSTCYRKNIKITYLKSNKSKNGAISSLRCVCVCEVAVNSKGVKTTQKSKSVPDTYLVVTNDDSVIGNVYENHLLELKSCIFRG